MKPVIGIVICGLQNNRQFVTDPYISCIEKSGGLPVIIPYIRDFNLFHHFLQLCDGFLFCGGDDISPLLFGEELIASYGKTDWNTDLFHISLMKEVLHSKTPVLGICRGMQTMNIALGGSVYQDISFRPESSLNHMQLSDKRSDPCHKIYIKENSKLYNICGNSFIVNSFHHQCLNKIGRNIQIIAKSSDNVAESIEFSNHPFALGLQWHPECMYDNSKEMQTLFFSFINFCR